MFEYRFRDIKLDNVLLDNQYNPVLTDYGFSRFMKVETLSDTFCGTRSHQAPELLAKKNYDVFKCDVWSLGIVLFILINKEYPFDRHQTSLEMVNKMNARDYALSKEIVENFFQVDLVKDLIDLLLEPDFHKRSNMDHVCEHNFFPLIQRECDTSSTLKSLDSNLSKGSQRYVKKN